MINKLKINLHQWVRLFSVFLAFFVGEAAEAKVVFSYMKSERISARNPVYENTNYSQFALGLEGSINFSAVDKMDSFIFNFNGELCRKDTLAYMQLEMPCSGVVLVSNYAGESKVSGKYFRGDRISISQNICQDFFVPTAKNIMTASDGLSFSMSLKCDEESPAVLERSSAGYVVNMEKILRIIFQDSNTGKTYDLGQRKVGYSPYLAKTPLNVPIVLGDIFSFLGFGCKSAVDCQKNLNK